MAYGSPNSLDEVGPYLSQVRGGREPTLREIERLKQRYEKVGGRTPLLQITMSQANALEQRLKSQGLSLQVYVGMKHWHPFIEDTVQEIVRNGVGSIVGIALAPYYSRMSIGGYEDAVKRGLAKQPSGTPFTMIRDWHKNSWLVQALSSHVRDGLNGLSKPQEAAVLFTAHSLPRKAVAPDDPYQSQLLETSNLVAKAAGVRSWDFAFQSAGEPEENWLGPQIKERIAKLAQDGFREVLVCPVGFVSDHLEILYDLDIEAKQYAGSAGVRLERTRSLNDDPEFVNALASLAMSVVKKQAYPLP